MSNIAAAIGGWTTVVTGLALVVLAAVVRMAQMRTASSSPSGAVLRVVRTTGAVTSIVLVGCVAVRWLGWQVPEWVAIVSIVVAVTALVAALVELHPYPGDDGLGLRVSTPRLIGAGLPAGVSIWAGVYLASAIATELSAFASPEADDVFSTLLHVLCQIPLAFVSLLCLGVFRRDPRNVASLTAIGTAAALAGVALLPRLIGAGIGRMVLLVLGLIVAGAFCIVTALISQTLGEDRRPGRANGRFTMAWSVVLGLGLLVAKPLVRALGVETVLWGVVALIVMTAPLLRLVPRHPAAGRHQPRAREHWVLVVRRMRGRLGLLVLASTAVDGFALTAFLGPLDAVTTRWAGLGVPGAYSAVVLVGIVFVVAALLQPFVGHWTDERPKLVLVTGAVIVALGFALAVVPALRVETGGVVTVVQGFLVLLGTMAQLTALPALLSSKGRSAEYAALYWAKYIAAAALALLVPLIGARHDLITLFAFAVTGVGVLIAVLLGHEVAQLPRSGAGRG